MKKQDLNLKRKKINVNDKVAGLQPAYIRKRNLNKLKLTLFDKKKMNNNNNNIHSLIESN